MKLLNRIICKIKFLLLKNIKPEMIPFYDFNGKKIKNSGVSNLTHISNKKNIVIGNNVFIGHFNYIDGFRLVIIEDGCQITNYVSILTHSSHNAIRIYGAHYRAEPEITVGLIQCPVKIGMYSFVGPHSLIMPGTIIGKGCIISAYSFVKGDFPDYSIIRGIPAKIVGDSRNIDSNLLTQFPEIAEYYYLNLNKDTK